MILHRFKPCWFGPRSISQFGMASSSQAEEPLARATGFQALTHYENVQYASNVRTLGDTAQIRAADALGQQKKFRMVRTATKSNKLTKKGVPKRVTYKIVDRETSSRLIQVAKSRYPFAKTLAQELMEFANVGCDKDTLEDIKAKWADRMLSLGSDGGDMPDDNSPTEYSPAQRNDMPDDSS